MEFEDRIPLLIAGYLRNELTASQQQELFDWVNASETNSLYFSKATEEKLLLEKFKRFSQDDTTHRLDKTLESIDPDSKSTSGGLWVKMKKYTVAACLLLVAGSGVYYIISNNASTKKDILTTTTSTNNNNDVQAGSEKAILTLADGSKVTLDNTANGTIAQQGNTVIMKEDGLLAYNTDRNKSQAGILYNTLTTEKGGEYRSLVLSDGTKVWLNSVSSIHYPTTFIGKERIVDIKGEVYFEVAKNRAMPFKVSVNGMEVEVLGTHFNINAYEDEPTIKTTLIEGAVKIVAGGKASFLKPGQQANLNTSGEIKVVNDADIEEAIAWKNGLFQFKKDSIQSIMRQVSRWYDVEITYEKEIPQTFSGTIPRSVNASKLLNYLELTKFVHFRIEGKKVTVME